MKRFENCDRSATDFTVELTQKGGKTIVSCGDMHSDLLTFGTQYTCTWGSNTKKFTWKILGTREWVCQIITDWVLANP